MSNTTRELSGQKFKLSQAANELLESYLKSIHTHFAKYPDGDEIYNDLQQRIAEKLSAVAPKAKQVEIEDVQKVVAEMGEVSDFDENTGGETVSDFTAQVINRFKFTRLKRDIDNQKIGGVAAGLANYLDIDPAIVRLAFCLALIVLIIARSPFSWIPLVTYLALWLSMPEAKSAVDKVEMKGKPVTLAEVRQQAVEVFQPRQLGTIGRIIDIPLEMASRLIRLAISTLSWLFPWTIRGMGLGIFLGGLVTFVAITTLASILFIGDASIFGVPLTTFTNEQVIVALTGLGYLILVIPVIASLALGFSLIRLRNVFRVIPVLAGVAFFIFALIGFGVIGFANAGQIQQNIRENPGIVTPATTTYSIETFNQLDVEGLMRVQVHQSDKSEIKVTALNRDSSNISFDVENNVLKLASAQGDQYCIFCIRYIPVIDIYTSDVTSISGRNRTLIEVTEAELGDLTVDLDLNAAFSFDGDVNNLAIEMQNHSTAGLNGNGEKLTVKLQDMSYIYARNFTVQNVEVFANGSTYTEVNVVKSLTGEASANAMVVYVPRSGVEVDVEVKDAARVTRYSDRYSHYRSDYAEIRDYFALVDEPMWSELREIAGDPDIEREPIGDKLGYAVFQLEEGYKLELKWTGDMVVEAKMLNYLGQTYLSYPDSSLGPSF